MKPVIAILVTVSAAAQAAVAKQPVELNNEGVRLFALGHYPEAGRLFAEALRGMEPASTNPLDLGRTLDNLAAVYRVQGDAEQAESYARRADELFERSPGIPDSERAAQRLILAAIYIDEKRFEEADVLLRSAASATQGSMGALALANLAALAIPLGDFDRAETLAREAVERAKATAPQERQTLAVAYNNLAQACRFQRKYIDAERYYRLAIEEWETAYGPDHPAVAKGLINLAGFFHDRERESGAEELYRRAIVIIEKISGPESAQALVARNELAEVLRAERRFSESDRLSLSTLAGMEKIFTPSDERLERALTNRAKLLVELRRDAEAAAIKTRLTRMQRTFR